MRKGFFNDPQYDNDNTAILNLPAIDKDIWQAVEAVDAASVEECVFRCTDCLIPSLRDAIDEALEDGGLDQVREFAGQLAQKERTWGAAEFIRYKALLAASGQPSLGNAAQLLEEAEQYELLPEVAETWDYVELMAREKYPDLPPELFQTPQAANVGRTMLEEGNATITDYGYSAGRMDSRFQASHRNIRARKFPASDGGDVECGNGGTIILRGQINSLNEIDMEHLDFEDIRWWHGTFHPISTGSGRDKKYSSWRGVQTRLGEIEEGLWYQLAELLIQRAGEQKLLEALTDWESRHNYAKDSARTVRHKALQLHISRIFDNPRWVNFIPFNREYRPEVLEHASLVTVINECCGKPGEVTQEQIDGACTGTVACPHCGRWSSFSIVEPKQAEEQGMEMI